MIPCNTCDFLILRKDFLLHCCTTNHKVRLLELYLISATFILSFFNSGVSKKTQPTSCSTIGELRNVVSHFMAGHLYIFWLAAMLINAQSFKNSPKDATLTKFYWTLVSVCIVHLMISLAELSQLNPGVRFQNAFADPISPFSIHYYLRPGFKTFIRRLVEHPRSKFCFYSSIMRKNLIPVLFEILDDKFDLLDLR